MTHVRFFFLFYFDTEITIVSQILRFNVRGSVKSKGCNEIIFISIVKRVFTVWRFLFTPAIHSISSYLVRGRNGLVCYNEVRCAAGFWHRFTSAKGDKNKMTAINIIPFRIKIFQTTFPFVRSEFSKCSIFDEKKGGGGKWWNRDKN